MLFWIFDAHRRKSDGRRRHLRDDASTTKSPLFVANLPIKHPFTNTSDLPTSLSMKLPIVLLLLPCWIQILMLSSSSTVHAAFVSTPSKTTRSTHTMAAAAAAAAAATLEPGVNICDLPGDPSLILTTNVDLGDKKMDIMKGNYILFLQNFEWYIYIYIYILFNLSTIFLFLLCIAACSKAIEKATGKPEAYIGTYDNRVHVDGSSFSRTDPKFPSLPASD